MFDAFKKFISELADGDKHPSRFEDNDYRLAAAALLVHAAAIDGDMSQSERDKLHAVIKQRFSLDDAATDELVEQATEAEHEAVDLYHFTHMLNRSLDEPGRIRIIEMMWKSSTPMAAATSSRTTCCGAPPTCSACRRASASSCAAASAARPPLPQASMPIRTPIKIPAAMHEAGDAHHRGLVRHRR